MRQHLLECLSNGTLIPFPSTGRRFQQPIAREKKFKYFALAGSHMMELRWLNAAAARNGFT